MDVTPRPDAVLCIQGISPNSYMMPLRALATSLFHRFTGVNLGFGPSVEAAAGSSPGALHDHPTPPYTVQLILAEWLAAFAVLEEAAVDKAKASGTLASHRAMTVSDLRDAGRCLPRGTIIVSDTAAILNDPALTAGIQAGTHFPTLSALLVFLADWYGAAVPGFMTLTNGDPTTVAVNVLPVVSRVHITSWAGKKGSSGSHPASHPAPAFELLKKAGSRLTTSTLVETLNTILSGSTIVPGTAPDGRMPEDPRWAFIMVLKEGPRGRGADDDNNTFDFDVVKSTSGTLGTVPCATDAAYAYYGGITVPLPRTVALASRAQLDALMTTKCVSVVRTSDKRWFPLLHFAVGDPALERLAIEASADTLVAALRSVVTPADFREVFTRTRSLYSTAEQTVVERLVRTAFQARFPSCPVPSQESVVSRRRIVAADAAGAGAGAGAGGGFSHVFVHPGRHVHPDEPLMMTILLTPDAWARARRDLGAVQAFFATHETLRSRRGSPPTTLFVSLDAKEGTYTPVAALVKRPVDDAAVSVTYASEPVPRALFAEGPLSQDDDRFGTITQRLLWSVVFMREDLLWVATQPSAKRLFKQLWDLHVPAVAGRRFKDQRAEPIVEWVLQGALEKVPKGSTWAPGAVLEMVFNDWRTAREAGSPAAVLDAMEGLMEAEGASCVFVEAPGAPPRIGTKAKTQTGALCVRTSHVGLPQEDGSTVFVDNKGRGRGAAAPTTSAKDITAWSEPFMRGLCLTATQAAVAAAFAGPAVLQSLQRVLDVCNPDLVNMPELAECVRRDKEDLHWFVVDAGAHARQPWTSANPDADASQASLMVKG
jgi:hypothetical protein